MDSQVVQPHYEEDPQNVGLHSVIEGEDDQHHHEKKSVLKKVKAKAKKLKETLTKHGHGHDDHGHERYDEHGHENEFDEEDDDDDDEEMIEDPEVHGAPIHESVVIRTAVIGQDETRGQPGDNTLAPASTLNRGNDVNRNFDHGQEGHQGEVKPDLGRSRVLEEDPHGPKDRHETGDPGNYQSKVTDPTGAGGEEAKITPIRQSFGKMSIHNEPSESKSAQIRQILPFGSHDQFSPELSPPTKLSPQNPQPEQPQNQSSYIDKLSAATTVIADKAITAKNVVASKLGYGSKDENTPKETHEGDDQTGTKSFQVGEYGKKIAATVTENLAPVYEKVAETGTTVISKVQGTGTGKETEGGVNRPDKGVSVKEYLVEKLRPGEEDKALSEVISETLHLKKEEGSTKSSKPMGKVMESEEVAKRLGSGGENRGERAESGEVMVDSGPGDATLGNSVAGKVKEAVSSWFGKGSESQSSQVAAPHGEGGFSGSASGEEGLGQRRLQKSSN